MLTISASLKKAYEPKVIVHPKTSTVAAPKAELSKTKAPVKSAPQRPSSTSLVAQAEEKPLARLSLEQLEDKALDAADVKDAALERLSDRIGKLNDEDKKEVGRSIFYNAALASGQFLVEAGRRKGEKLSPTEIREQVKRLSPEERAEVEGQVKTWIDENPLEGQIAIANGASDWAIKTAHPSLPIDELAPRLGILQDSNDIRSGIIEATDATHEVFQRDPELAAYLLEEII